ncbi:hypothetical protein MLD38_035791 [Melastoma candidum]|uniref:Uncharacterized protein n=1 Tax=Melastoma candidum TaxID=119954 RepID=A0ACB9LHP0_9MYRT|nr:hypothetical protein MLD38_035791 [Melastoma candidum]
MARGRGKAVAVTCPKKDSKADKARKKRNAAPQEGEGPSSTRKMPRREAACRDFREKVVRNNDKESLIERKKSPNPFADSEDVAIRLTLGKGERGRANRRLTDFVLHDSKGTALQLEMLEHGDLFITGLVLPLDEESDSEKSKSGGVKCEGFGRVESWAISGYEEGYPIVWLSTEIADYECLKPAGSYKKLYDQFYEKSRACIEVYKKLSKSWGGDPDCSLDELLAAVARTMSSSKTFPNGSSIKNFVLSQGEFIFNQLVSLDATSKENDSAFAELPVLCSLREEGFKHVTLARASMASARAGIAINSGHTVQKDAAPPLGENEDMKLARLLQEDEYWKSIKQKKNYGSSCGSTKFYIKINEDEIANDYPLPAYYRSDLQEMDEFLLHDGDVDMVGTDDLPRNMLNDWSLYNSDSRLISLELVPMRSCDDIDITIFGSGMMTADDGSVFCLDMVSNQCGSSSSKSQHEDGIPIYLSAIKEWMIEFGSSMMFVTIRTDMAWYRLGRPSKQYAPWYETVLRTARLGISIITLLKEQTRVSKLSFGDIIKKVSEFEKTDKAYISSNPAIVENYIVVHGQIILQLFAEYPDQRIKKCAFVLGLSKKMEERHHTKWLLQKKKMVEKMPNLNPRALMGPTAPKRKAMQATTTRLINRIWGEYYSNYSPEDQTVGPVTEENEDEDDDNEEADDNEEDDAEEALEASHDVNNTSTVPRPNKLRSGSKEIEWNGVSSGETEAGEALYSGARVHGSLITVGTAVQLEADESDNFSSLYFVEYLYETSKGKKLFHGRKLVLGSQTVLGNAANEQEMFLLNDCENIRLENIRQAIVVDIRLRPWGYHCRKTNAEADALARVKAEERKKKGLLPEFYCKSLYWPERGAFVSLPQETIGLGSGSCSACKIREAENEKQSFKLISSKAGFVYEGVQYNLHDFVYVSPHCFAAEKIETGTFKSGRNVGLKAYVVCQLMEIISPEEKKRVDATSAKVKVRRYYRPEDISTEKAYFSDIREVYYTEETEVLPIENVKGKCEVRKKKDLPPNDDPVTLQHVFFCESFYDPLTGSLKQLSSNIKMRYSAVTVDSEAVLRKRKGKGKEVDTDMESDIPKGADKENRLPTLDIFAGCGGLSEGLQKSGVSVTKWAIEYEEPAADAFKLNHPQAAVFVNNCNVILRAIMQKCGDIDECISTPEAEELAKILDDKVISELPIPGQVDFINGGPPCQGFSGMNRFNQSTWSKVQCEMILAFLSYADYFRPKYFLLENVRNFVSFNKGQTFCLTLASLLEMGYQVRFGILEAGAYGVSQSRKRAFIWAAAPGEVLPEWPEPMHVFAAPELKVSLSGNAQYAAARSTASGAAFRAITVKDTIGELPPVSNGASRTSMEYGDGPASWFQKKIRANADVLTDHISKEMNELNLIRCQRVPKRPGADWRDLPDEKVKLSTGQVVDLIPWCLPHTAKRHNQWKGLFGRLDWEGNFPTSVTDPQPMGKVGMCFHPDQDRILSVRECARSQGFPDSYRFAGNIQHKHRQIGNAVPPPLAYALGMKLKEAIDSRKKSQPEEQAS